MTGRTFFQTSAGAASMVAIGAQELSAAHISNVITGDAFDAGRRAYEAATNARGPVEVDLGDPAARRAGYWRYSETDAYVRLSELRPADPGELSGFSLRVIDAGVYMTLCALVGTHWLGFLEAQEAAEFSLKLRCKPEEPAEIELWEQYRLDVEQRRASGARLVNSGGQRPQLCLYFGLHCFGSVEGDLLAAFLECLLTRSPRPRDVSARGAKIDLGRIDVVSD